MTNPPSQITTPELVEKVARVIANKRLELLNVPNAYWRGDGEWNGKDLVLTPDERDRYRAEARAAIECIEATSNTLQDRVRELEEALRPFADLDWRGTIWEGEFEPDDSIVFHNVATRKEITLGDFRKARAALKLIGEE